MLRKGSGLLLSLVLLLAADEDGLMKGILLLPLLVDDVVGVSPATGTPGSIEIPLSPRSRRTEIFNSQ